MNGDIYLLRRPDDGEFYLRPTKYVGDSEMPVDQRKIFSGLKSRKLLISPVRDFSISASDYITEVNEALVAYEGELLHYEKNIVSD